MPPAARIGDATLHDGTVTSGCDSVVIAGSPASRFLDQHCCGMTDPDGRAHIGGDIVQGSESVIIGEMPAARLGDECICYGPPVTADVPLPSSSSSASPFEITRDVDISDESGSEDESHINLGRDGIDAEGNARYSYSSRRIRARWRAGGHELGGLHGGYDLGTAEARGRGHVGLDGASGEGSASARTASSRIGGHLGDRDNPIWSEEAEFNGPGAAVSRSSRRENGIGENVAAGAEAGSITRRTRLTTPTFWGQNAQLATEGSASPLATGGMIGSDVYHDEQEGRTHIRGQIDSSALLAIITLGASELLPAPSVGGSFDISWGRAFGDAGESQVGSPTLPPFLAGPNEITSGEDTVLIGD